MSEELIPLLVASTNKKKLLELEEFLSGLPFKLQSLSDYPDFEEVEENGKTFEENAILKAKGYAALSGMLTLAEDSGLCCDALDGAPGIYSARFSGEGDDANNAKLLRLMKTLPDNCRQAHYTSCVAIADPERIIGVAEGEVHGYIHKELCGENGFGYDPLFYYPEYEKTFGEVSPELKQRVSHRTRALEKARVVLAAYMKKVVS